MCALPALHVDRVGPEVYACSFPMGDWTGWRATLTFKLRPTGSATGHPLRRAMAPYVQGWQAPYSHTTLP